MSLLNDLDPINHKISLQLAIEMTARYRSLLPELLRPPYDTQDVLLVAETFKKSIFSDLASQPGCVAIRSYLGMDENNKVRLIFVGVDNNNHDILSNASGSDGFIFEYGQRCPPICVAGVLNPQI